MRVGYVRCSTAEQNEARQLKMMQEQGAEKLFPENGKSIRSQRGSRRHLPHSRLPRKIPP